MALAGPPRSHENEVLPGLFSRQCLEGVFSEVRAWPSWSEPTASGPPTTPPPPLAPSSQLTRAEETLPTYRTEHRRLPDSRRSPALRSPHSPWRAVWSHHSCRPTSSCLQRRPDACVLRRRSTRRRSPGSACSPLRSLASDPSTHF